MTFARSSRLRLALGLALGALTLVACGRTGSLQPAAPLFGEKARASYESDRTRQQVARRAKRDGTTASGSTNQSNADKTDSSSASDDDGPLTKRDIKDPGQLLRPLSSAPSPGAPDPLGPPPSLTPPN